MCSLYMQAIYKCYIDYFIDDELPHSLLTSYSPTTWRHGFILIPIINFTEPPCTE